EQRERAMDEVNGALALDPGNQRGLELLRRILSHTPAVLPPAVEAAQRNAEEQAYASVARSVSLRMAMWMALVPLIWAMGPLSVPLAAGGVATVVIVAGPQGGVRVELRGKAGTFRAGRVPPGTYEIRAMFDGTLVEQDTLRIEGGETVTIKCSKLTQVCSVQP
ncbi:MAG: carboxypeptidase-like regulatory domain-containing protein, partial [Myxococcota bacterium]